jgi:hypothetical protein
MKSLISIVLALGTIAAVSGQAMAENDNDRSTENAASFYQKLDAARQ